jgi:hypothetical protein
MSRRGAPALYELMRKPGSGPAPARSPAAGASRRQGQAPSIPDSFTLTLGQAVLAGLGVVVAIAIAFGIGVQRGKSASRAPEVPEQGVAAASPAIPTVPAAQAKPAAISPTSTEIANNNGDPRIKGYRYFVLCHPSSQRARDLVDFCRKNGLDAHLVPDDTSLNRKVIVLPGYKDSSDKSLPEIKALEANIRRVGEKWKAAAKGNQDFSGYFPQVFQ